MTSPTPTNYSSALQDPEFLAMLAQLQASLANQNAELDAQDTGIRTQYGRQLRDAGQQLPTDLKRSTESAAGRGMLYSGGLLEEQGSIQKRFADFNANIGEDQATALSGTARGRNAANSNFNSQRDVALQGAAGRALERSKNAPIAPTTGAPANPGAPVPGAVETVNPGTFDASPMAPVAAPVGPITPPGGPQQTVTDATVQNYVPSGGNFGGFVPTANPAQTTLGDIQRATGQTPAAPRPAAPTASNVPAGSQVIRPMSSFDATSQQKLSLGQVVVAGDGRRMKYDPNTGKVVPV